MTVYVDDMYLSPMGVFSHAGKTMKMSHMVADTEAELHAMARRIGIARKWFQDPKTMQKVSHPHYDICKSKRDEAIKHGAKPVTMAELAAFVDRRDSKSGQLL